MSLIPFILDLADELHEFSRCLAHGIDINDFGFGLYSGSEQQQQQHQQSSQQQQPSSHQQQSPRRSRTSSFSSFWMPSKRHHPYNRIKSACCGKSVGDEGGVAASPEKDALPTGTPGKTASYSVVNKNGFQVSMNVKQFAPNELSVKTIDNCIVVEGRHDDKEDGHGVISRHFVRKYMLPKGYDPKDVLSTLSSDGILTVKAPPPPPPSAKTDEPNERIVEIQPTPGPTQVVPVVSAKESQSKEQTTKKLSSPAARAECQLPEKRQKLDLPQEQQESTEPQAPTTPLLTPPSASAASALSDGDTEKTDEKTAENEKQTQKQKQEQQQEEGSGGGMETNSADVAEDQADKQLEKKEAMEIDETDKTVEEEKLPETNGDKSTESAEANEPVAAKSCTTSAKDNDVPAENVIEAGAKSSKSEISKMDVDGEVADNNADNGAEVKVDAKKETETKADSKAKAIETNNTNSTSTSTPTKNVKKDDKDNTAKTTGELPADAGNNTTTTTSAESASDTADDTETTAVSPSTEANNTDIDDVALLKAAVTTADDSDITAEEKNAILTEPMDGIATTDSPPSAAVECSLFAKTHLGNGNSNSALVAKEEVAN